MLVLSIAGLVKTVLILIGVFVLLRLIGQLMIAKRNLAEQQKIKQHENQIKSAKKYVDKNMGKTSILQPKNTTAQDIDYEEL